MHVTMVKKRLISGEDCKKCQDAEALLQSRGLWSRIDEVAWAIEGHPESPGVKLAAQYQIDLAPFFVVQDDNGQTRVYTSTLQFIKEALGGGNAAPALATKATAPVLPSAEEIARLAPEFDNAPPEAHDPLAARALRRRSDDRLQRRGRRSPDRHR